MIISKKYLIESAKKEKNTKTDQQKENNKYFLKESSFYDLESVDNYIAEEIKKIKEERYWGDDDGYWSKNNKSNDSSDEDNDNQNDEEN